MLKGYTRDFMYRATTGVLKVVSRIWTLCLYRSGKIPRETYCSRLEYPQTWAIRHKTLLTKRWWILRGRCYHNPIGKLVEGICGILTGHEFSETEFGYGGGEFIDRNCRWCDKPLKEPIEESVWAVDGILADMVQKIRSGDVEIAEADFVEELP